MKIGSTRDLLENIPPDIQDEGLALQSPNLEVFLNNLSPAVKSEIQVLLNIYVEMSEWWYMEFMKMKHRVSILENELWEMKSVSLDNRQRLANQPTMAQMVASIGQPSNQTCPSARNPEAGGSQLSQPPLNTHQPPNSSNTNNSNSYQTNSNYLQLSLKINEIKTKLIKLWKSI